jgi:hypothetical protein
MQRARIKFKEKTILDNGLIMLNEKFNKKNDDEIYFAFFDDSEVSLYSKKSQFVAKIKTDELERLIQQGNIQVIP